MKSKTTKVVKVYSDHIQKRIEDLENQINHNCLKIYNEWKSALEEAYLEGVVEYETALVNYNATVETANSTLYLELEHIYKTCEPMYTIDLADIYFCTTKQ